MKVGKVAREDQREDGEVKKLLRLDPHAKRMEGDLVMTDSETGESVKDLPGDRVPDDILAAEKVWARMKEERNK